MDSYFDIGEAVRVANIVLINPRGVNIHDGKLIFNIL